MVQNSSAEKTDTGSSETDQASLKPQKPVVTFISEDNLKVPQTYLLTLQMEMVLQNLILHLLIQIYLLFHLREILDIKKVYDLSQDSLERCQLVSMPFFLNQGYKLKKSIPELDTSTTSVANDYKLTAATDDTITIASSDATNVAAIQSYLAGKKVFNLAIFDQFRVPL